jgi:hypothetical protein
MQCKMVAEKSSAVSGHSSDASIHFLGVDRMKTLIALLAFCTTFALVSCSGKKSDITVGMTYDEVEKVLGKPMLITRGVNELRWSDGDTVVFPASTEVHNTGELLYVTWTMYDRKTDTLHTFQLWDGKKINEVPVKKYYEVHEVYCVNFEASSGRVVMMGYEPLFCVQCK